MSIIALSCGACGDRIAVQASGPQQALTCPSCAQAVEVYPLPALWKSDLVGQGGEAVVLGSESTCFYHPEKRAVQVCEGCGRYLCSLCDIEFHGAHVCASCIERGIHPKGRQQPATEYTYFDNVALSIALIPTPMLFPTLFTAPVALFVALWWWRKPISAVRRSKLGFVVTILIAVVQLGIWIALFSGIAAAVLAE